MSAGRIARLAMALAAALAARAGAEPQAPRGAGGTRMLELDLAVEVQDAVAGGALPVAVKLRNAGSAAEQVEDPTSGSPFLYDVTAVRDGTLRQIGARIYFLTARPNPLPLPPPDMQTLAAGEALEYREDLSRWALEPLPPGDYRVTAVYVHGGEIYRSAPRPLRVVLPRIERVVATANISRGRLGEVVVQAIGKEFAVAQRESAKPGAGTWLERIRTSARIGGLAIASEVDEDSPDRWIAWLEGGAFRAGIWQEGNQIRLIDPVPLGLDSPVLLPHGWQYADARAVFVAAGISGGRAVAKFVTVAVEGDPQVHQDDLAAALPQRLGATFVREGARDAVYLCWTEEQPDGTKIWARKYVPARPVRNAAVMIAESAEPLAAIAFEPVASGSPAMLRALFGPAAMRKMTYSLIPLARGGTRRDVDFTAPAAREAPGPWSIAAGPGRNYPVIVHVGNRLMSTWTGKSDGWQAVADNVPRGRAVDLICLVEPWAVWVDPEAGMRYQRLPR